MVRISASGRRTRSMSIRVPPWWCGAWLLITPSARGKRHGCGSADELAGAFHESLQMTGNDLAPFVYSLAPP